MRKIVVVVIVMITLAGCSSGPVGSESARQEAQNHSVFVYHEDHNMTCMYIMEEEGSVPNGVDCWEGGQPINDTKTSTQATTTSW